MKLIKHSMQVKRSYTERFINYLENINYMKKICEKWLKSYWIHLLIWSIFIFYEVFVIGLISGAFGHPLNYIAHYLIVIVFFYLYGDVGFSWAMNKKKAIIWRVPIILILAVIFYMLSNFVIDTFLHQIGILKGKKIQILQKSYSLMVLFRCIYILVFANGYYFLKTWIREKKETTALKETQFRNIILQQETEKELTRAQNAFLKAQINPHFLFNTLDFVYHKISNDAPEAAGIIIHLSEMMRYAIDADKRGDFILLEEEIDQVENLLNLSQARMQHEIDFDYNPAVLNLKIIPLVLLTLVENVFKHGNLALPDHKASIILYTDETNFFIKTDNLTDRFHTRLSNHTGLVNIEKRLKFAYGDDYKFSYQNIENGHFQTLLKIPLALMEVKDGDLENPKKTEQINIAHIFDEQRSVG
jgi:two-component system LytT family sensor kinase